MSAQRAPVSDAAFRDWMRQWATGVAVLLAPSGGQWRGMTVNALTSVSLDPPSVLVVVAKARSAHACLVPACGQRFTLSFLRSGQSAAAERFARHAHRGVDAEEVGSTAAGHPYWPGALAWLDCRVARTHDAGDHTIVVAAVHDGGAAPKSRAATPLLFWEGTYIGR